MNLVILHYHLRPGGVTEVIRNQLRALCATTPPTRGTGGTSVLVLSGETSQADVCEGVGENRRFEVSVKRIDGLRYSNARPHPERLARRIRDAVCARWGPKARPIYHFHNHSLAKNYSVPGAVLAIAEEGEHVLLQIHDFAEDRRPATYAGMLARIAGGDPDALRRILYPVFSNVHFAALNQRDFKVLQQFGIARDRLHLLPNAARRLEPAGDPESCRKRVIERIGQAGHRELTPTHRLFFYPARGIRRKNLGEALLLSALSPEDTWFGMSLAPRNPVQRPQYEMWLRVARELRLPFRFGLAQVGGVGFLDYMGAAHSALTTSVAEGFGLAFIEPWTAGRPVVGRDLPWISADLKRNGMRLGHLYRRLWVPVGWVGARALRERLGSTLESFYGRYGRTLSRRAVEDALKANSTDGHVDFGLLDEELQLKVIERATTGARARRRLLSANPSIDRAMSRSMGRWRATIEHNRDIASRVYSIERYGKRLREIYETLGRACRGRCDGPTRSRACGMHLLDYFLRPQDFRMLRS